MKCDINDPAKPTVVPDTSSAIIFAADGTPHVYLSSAAANGECDAGGHNATLVALLFSGREETLGVLYQLNILAKAALDDFEMRLAEKGMTHEDLRAQYQATKETIQ